MVLTWIAAKVKFSLGAPNCLRMAHAESLGDASRQSLAVDYFKQRIECPFLDRPLVCREYLVITPAVNCSQPAVVPVVRITLPAPEPSVDLLRESINWLKRTG